MLAEKHQQKAVVGMCKASIIYIKNVDTKHVKKNER